MTYAGAIMDDDDFGRDLERFPRGWYIIPSFAVGTIFWFLFFRWLFDVIS